MMKNKPSYKITSAVIIFLGVLILVGLVTARWNNASGRPQAQSSGDPSPDQQIIERLQSILSSAQMSSEDRLALQKKLELTQNLETQREQPRTKGPKPTGPNVPPVIVPTQAGQVSQPLIPNIPEGTLVEGSGGLVHPWEANVTNAWENQINDVTYQVLAGSSPDDPQAGWIIVIQMQDNPLKRSRQTYIAPGQTGSLRIQSVKDNLIFLSTASGANLTFDLSARAFK